MDGVPIAPPTEYGTGCPGEGEYLLCTEDTSNSLDSCKNACMDDADCVGFMVLWIRCSSE